MPAGRADPAGGLRFVLRDGGKATGAATIPSGRDATMRKQMEGDNQRRRALARQAREQQSPAQRDRRQPERVQAAQEPGCGQAGRPTSGRTAQDRTARAAGRHRRRSVAPTIRDPSRPRRAARPVCAAWATTTWSTRSGVAPGSTSRRRRWAPRRPCWSSRSPWRPPSGSGCSPRCRRRCTTCCRSTASSGTRTCPASWPRWAGSAATPRSRPGTRPRRRSPRSPSRTATWSSRCTYPTGCATC